MLTPPYGLATRDGPWDEGEGEEEREKEEEEEEVEEGEEERRGGVGGGKEGNTVIHMYFMYFRDLITMKRKVAWACCHYSQDIPSVLRTRDIHSYPICPTESKCTTVSLALTISYVALTISYVM